MYVCKKILNSVKKEGGKEGFAHLILIIARRHSSRAARREKKRRDSLVGVWLLAVDGKKKRGTEAGREYAKAEKLCKVAERIGGFEKGAGVI